MLFVYLTYTFVGVLSLQLLISHYSKPFVDKNEIINQEDKPRAMFRTTATSTCCWAYHQIQCVTDIKCPAYMDWFHGGLNMHSIHHLFPRMSRYHYRAVYNDVLELGKRNGVPIDQQCFSEALMNVTHQLGKVGKKSL
jgi:delta8-fatty-acid desaturase